MPLAAVGFTAAACATQAPTPVPDGEQSKTHALISVDRTEPAAPESPGSASAIARFVSVPAYSDTTRVLVAAGAEPSLPPADTCQTSGADDDLEPPLPSQDPIEFVEAGDVTLTAGGATTPLAPHAFPTVGSFASGVLYTTRDRAADGLPPGARYTVTVTGSASIPAFGLVGDAPSMPRGVQIGGADLKDVTEVHTGRPLELTWTPGDATDQVYVELLAYDGSTSVLCSFRDETGAGSVPADAFSGAGAGRLAIHRVRLRRVEGGTAPAGDIRFDFQVGAPVEFAR